MKCQILFYVKKKNFFFFFFFFPKMPSVEFQVPQTVISFNVLILTYFFLSFFFFFLFSQENRIQHFVQTVPFEGNLHEMSNPVKLCYSVC